MLVFVMLSRLFFANGSWERKRLHLGSRVCFVFLVIVTFPNGVSDQVWYLIVSVPYICLPFYFIFIGIAVTFLNETYLFEPISLMLFYNMHETKAQVNLMTVVCSIYVFLC